MKKEEKKKVDRQHEINIHNNPPILPWLC